MNVSCIVIVGGRVLGCDFVGFGGIVFIRCDTGYCLQKNCPVGGVKARNEGISPPVHRKEGA